jgi:hypothetical protein
MKSTDPGPSKTAADGLWKSIEKLLDALEAQTASPRRFPSAGKWYGMRSQGADRKISLQRRTTIGDEQ